MFNTMIIGGGIHGTLLQLAILREQGEAPAVVDTESEPLAVWKRTTRACGMRFLRSSSSHNLELDFHALRRFARKNGYREGRNHFVPPYMRPSLELFNAHADYLVRRHNLDDRIRDRVEAIEPEGGGFLLRGRQSNYRARRVILAPGNPPPVLPWPEEKPVEPERALHVFDNRFSLDSFLDLDSVAIVGCGVTGGQLALALAARGVERITMFDINEPSMSDYDGNPCYVGPKCAEEFETIGDPVERRKVIVRQRYPGSLPRDIYAELSSLWETKTVTIEQGRVTHLSQVGESIEVELSSQQDSPRIFSFDRVIAATGFAALPPANDLIAPLATHYQLPQGPRGYPFSDENLQWMPGLYVAGALGELRIGPAARNIIGAHLAARRILPTLEDSAA